MVFHPLETLPLTWGQREPEGQRLRGRLFWPTFFGDTKKVGGCRATPGLHDLQLFQSHLECGKLGASLEFWGQSKFRYAK